MVERMTGMQFWSAQNIIDKHISPILPVNPFQSISEEMM